LNSQLIRNLTSKKNTASRRLNPDRKFIPFRFTVG
jgi:hypothetical protein